MIKKQNEDIDLGVLYETRIVMRTFVDGYTRELKDFKLESQVVGTEKFDDVVFDDGSGMCQMIQLKHKKNEKINSKQLKNTEKTKKNVQNEQPNQSTSQQEELLVKQVIKVSDLFNEKYNSNYNLIKYVKDFNYANSTDRFKDKIKAAVIFTNIGFDLLNNELNLKGCPSKSANEWFAGINLIKLTQITPEPAAIYNMTSVAPDAKYYKFSDDPNIVQILQRQAVTVVHGDKKKKENSKRQNDKDEVLKLDDVTTEDEIRAALDKIVYAVEQPNVHKLPDIIKNEIKNHFKLNDADTLYSILAEYFRVWFETKPVLTYADADKFFQRNVKQVSFGVTAPTDAFVGRVEELEKIRQQLNKESSLIVSSTLTISGLGGIGKTQLVKQFIKQFGQSEFYGRIVWIEAQNDETVKTSFEQLAQLLKIKDVYNMNIKVLIHEVFDYFTGFKVLFVFDNFDKSSAYEGNLVTQCWRTASDSTKKGRPYFLFTSRNRNCLPKVPLLELNVLSPEEAVKLISNELTEVTVTKADAEKLANVLQCFPLALRQAIAYIQQQHKMKKLFGERYEIQDYLKKFSEDIQNPLNFEFPDDFGEKEKTTFITWNVTLEGIKAEKVHGANAIQALKLFAYLYADKIDPKMFLTLFENDEEKTAAALLLLEKYSMVTKLQQHQSTFYQIHRLVQAVIQIKFQNESGTIQEQAFTLINPKIYETHDSFNKKNFIERQYDASKMRNLMRECSTDQILHYNNLSVYMLKHDHMKTKYEKFFNDLNDRVLFEAAFQDDVEKVKALEISGDEIKKFLETSMKNNWLMSRSCNKVIKYFIESGQLGVNNQIGETSLIKRSVENHNVEIFKYLIEQGAAFSEFLEPASLQLVSDIKNGKSSLLQSVFKNKSDSNQKILIECLFFALIFNQESIVWTLLKNINEPNPKYKDWTLIEVAAKLEFENLLEILASLYDQDHLKECLRQLLRARYFSDKKAFEIICKEFFKRGGHLDDKDEIWEDICENFNIEKLNLTHFLLDNGADHTFSSYSECKILRYLLKTHEKYVLSVDDKFRVDELLNRIIFHNLTPDKFIDVAVFSLFRIDNWSKKEYYRHLFGNMVKKIVDINAKNEKGETLLIKYVQDIWQDAKRDIETVKYLVEHRFDVEAQDNEEKSALYYAFKEGEFEIYEFLLDQVKSVTENVLELVIERDDTKYFQKLLGKYVSADFCFKNGKTLIEVAVENISPKLVLLWKDEFKSYRERGGDVNRQDETGRTLLIRLMQYYLVDGAGDIDDVKFLIENGLQIDIQDEYGFSAIYWAVSESTKDIFFYLLKNSHTVEDAAVSRAIKGNVLSKVEDLPQNFNKNSFLSMKSDLLEDANEEETNLITEFLNQLETEHESKPVCCVS